MNTDPVSREVFRDVCRELEALKVENEQLRQTFKNVAAILHKEDWKGEDALLRARVAVKALTRRYLKECPSTYTHSSLGTLTCEKDEAHLRRIGDVEHRRENTVWFSI